MTRMIATGCAVLGMVIATSAAAQESLNVVGRATTGIDTAAVSGAATGVRGLGSWLGELDGIRAGLERNDGFIASDDEVVFALLFAPDQGESELLRRYMKDLVTAMDEVPDAFYDRLDATVSGLWSEIRRLAPRLEEVRGEPASPQMQLAVAGRIAQASPGAQVVRTVLSGTKWLARVDDLGMPRTEYRRGYVLYRIPGQSLTICQQVVFERPYYSGSDDMANYSVRLGYLRLQESE